jgi:hypothetical protein
MSQGESSDVGAGFAGWTAIIGGSLAIAGSYLPWLSATAASFGTVISRGTDGKDGKMSLVAGFVIIGVGIFLASGAIPRNTAGWLLLPGSLLVGMVATLNYIDVQRRMSLTVVWHPDATPSVGTGIWVLTAAWILTLLACVSAFTGWTPAGREKRSQIVPPRADV